MPEHIIVFFDLALDQEGSHTIARSEQFSFAGVGISSEEAIENLRQSMRAYLRSHKRRGNLMEALTELGAHFERVECEENEGLEVV